jgi:rhodanese-related sulfurtransferase
MKTRSDLLSEARKTIPEMTVQEVHDHLATGEMPVLLDVRGLDEWDRGHLEGAVHIPRGKLEEEVEGKLPDKSKDVIVYCAGGVRSLLAGQTLKQLGYQNVTSMEGGFGDWEDAGLPAEVPPPPAEDETVSDPALIESQITHLEQVLAQKRDLLKRSQ